MELDIWGILGIVICVAGIVGGIWYEHGNSK